MKIKLKIKRFEPEKRKSFFKVYNLDFKEGDTVLSSLVRIQEDIDGSLAFRYSCRSGSCGSCGMTINGEARLACETLISNLVGISREIRIEPMHNMTVIKDLVTDMDVFWSNIEKIIPWVVNGESNIESYRVEKLKKTMDCIYCGLCFSACPAIANSSFLGPASLAKFYRFLNDPRDSLYQERINILHMDMEKIAACTRCGSCDDVCPKKIPIKETIIDTTNEIVKLKNINSLGFKCLDQRNKGGRNGF